jgi:hypothetical protein
MRKVVLAAALALAFLGAARQRSVHPPASPSLSVTPTFSKEIVRIFQDKCQTCHHPGDIGPFSMMTYAETRPHYLDIKYMTQTRQMPPWKPSLSCAELADPRILSQNEIDLIAKWVDAGAPRGDDADLPAALNFAGGWSLGQPDLVLKNDKPYTPPATTDMYRCFSMPAKTTGDKWVSAIDIRPGDRATVHHVLAFVDTNGSSAKLVGSDGSYQCFGGPGFTITDPGAATLGGWAPGYRAALLPEDVAFKLPANARIVLQVHYHPHTAAPAADQTEIGIYYAKTTPKKQMYILPLVNENFTIPPNDANYPVNVTPVVMPLAAHAWLIAPHMHLLGRKIHMSATLPGKGDSCLVSIDDWDFNWQGMYRFKDPIALPFGSKLTLNSIYDNSVNNARNPNNPPKPVSWGEATTDEMCLGFIGITFDDASANAAVDTSWIPRLTR